MIEAQNAQNLKKTEKQVNLYFTAQKGNNNLFWSFASVYINDAALYHTIKCEFFNYGGISLVLWLHLSGGAAPKLPLRNHTQTVLTVSGPCSSHAAQMFRNANSSSGIPTRHGIPLDVCAFQFPYRTHYTRLHATACGLIIVLPWYAFMIMRSQIVIKYRHPINCPALGSLKVTAIPNY